MTALVSITVFHFAAWVALLIVAVLIFLVLFEPGLAYRTTAANVPLDSHSFLGLVASVIDAQLLGRSRVEVLTNGAAFYSSELEAIRAARHSIHIEAYIFRPGRVSARFLDALAERARAGVRVRLIIDAIGSAPMRDRFLKHLRTAGGQVYRYDPIRWYTLKRFNNRTHREIIVVDGMIGFTGGAGIADWWVEATALGEDVRGRPWRDTMIRLEGELVGGLQTTFIENWLEASGEMLADVEHFPFCRADRTTSVAGSVHGLVVSSTPSAGRGTRARMLFQLLVASALDCIEICSPYFVPDRSMRRELVRAAQRGVTVRIIVPGPFNNHRGVRWTSRRLYGELLQNGIEIYEYRPTMTHAKIALIDGLWSVLGSTNFDNRSFGLNDEINIAIVDRVVAIRLRDDFARDLGQSDRISLSDWKERSATERLLGAIVNLFARQQ